MVDKLAKAPAPGPDLAVNDIRISEANDGTTLATFTLSLSQPSASPVTATYATGNGTAFAPADYTTAASTVTIPAGASTAPVAISVVGDTVDEDDETFFLNVLSASGARILDGQGTATIVDNDPGSTVTLSVADATAQEGAVLSFSVTLSPAQPAAVEFSYRTSPGGTASNGDIVPDAGTITMPIGATSATITVASVDDTAVEASETFFVDIVDASAGVTITRGQAVGTITDDDRSGGGAGGGGGTGGGTRTKRASPPATAWWPPTAGSSPSVTPRSTAPPGPSA